MPVLSSFISYRPGRKRGNNNKATIGKISSPFPVQLTNDINTPHPYASPPIIDIHDERGRSPSPSPEPSLERPSNDYYSTSSPPQMRLDVDINPSPLASWFPPDLLKSDPFTVNLGEEAPEASGSKSYHGNGPNVAGLSRLREEYPAQRPSYEEDMDEDSEDEDDEIEAEEVLAGMDISYGDIYPPEDVHGTPTKRPAPTPIKIPNTNIHGPKVQVVRSAEQSRPTSQISSPESSAVSGTSFARALMGNSFFLSSDARGSKYRSGFSTLTRTDSATLPRGEYGLINSPYWRGSTGSSLLSPPIPSAPVPPVPDNADQVYVPPQIGRQSGEPKRSRSANATSISATPTEQEREEAQAHRQDEEDAQALRRISRISETKTSLESTVQDHSTAAEEPGPTNTQTQQQTHNSSYSISSIDKGKSRRYSMMPESVRSDSDIMSDGVGSPSVFSDPPSSGGREDLDNVLDYYQLEESLDQLSPPGGYRLPFSPITEETSSQLSPPAPYNRPDSRSSSIKTPGRYFFGASPSATMGGVRVDWSMKRTSEARSGSRDSISKQLLPIGERPPTTQATSPNGASTHVSRPSIGKNTLGPSSGGDGRSLLPPPPLSTIRGRSGSAPSPIQVLRDSKDPNSYTIMVTPRTGDSGEHTASTDDSEMLRQDFPQTPNAFSPGFSPGLSSATSPRDDSYNGVGEPGPTTPMSALLPSNRAIQPSLAQQVLLTRAATSVHGARHSRQNSLSKMVRVNGGLPPPANRPTSAIVNHTPAGQDPTSSDETLAEKDGSQMGHDYAHSNTSLTSLTSTSSRRNESHPSQSSDSPLIQEPFTEAGSTQSQSPFHGSQEVQLPREGVTSPATTVTVAPASPALSNNTEGSTGLAYMHSQPSSGLSSPQPEGQASQRSSGSHYTPLESPRVLPTVPPSPSVVVPPPPPPPPPPAEPSSNTASPNLTNADIAPSPRVGRVPIPPNQSRIPAPAPPSTTPVMSPPAPLPNSLTTTPIISPSAPLPSSPLVRHPMIINPPPPHARLTSTQGSAASIYGYSMDSAPTGSPPPYSSIVNTHERALDTVNVTPTTSGSYDPNYRFGMTPVSPPANIGRFTTTSEPSSTPGQNTSPLPSRQRARPAIPIGPRRPSAQHPHGHGSLPPSTWAARERGGSVSSVGSAVPASRRVQAQNLPSPKFPTPTPKFRGFTMDAAKWTFTSSQLQDIVSRAIRQSSEASFIRLLQLETLDEEIPDEIDRLEALKSHIKANYKNLSRRRTTLLDSLTSCMDSTDPDAKSRALRFMEDLRDISANLDKLTEELNSVNEQLAQVNHITQLHSTSALAMALRKLNGSFLKQFQEAQTLREQVSSLQAERDEAWKQAEKVANDYDDLRSGLVDSPDSETKLSRVTASRNASVRATKAGLRSASRVSQRLSVGSNSLRGLTTPNSARTTFHEEVPPVPPIPRHRPEEIRTNLPLRNSVTIVSTSTPNSETRAMVRVTEELYDMLGISLNENRGRRSRSVIGLPGEADQAGSPSYSYYDPPPNTGRRNSLPGSAALPPDPYNSLAADVNTILNSDRSGWI